MQIALSCLKTYTRLNQNEVKEPKPSTHFQSIQNPLSRKDPGLPTLIYTPNVLSENILINLQSLKTKQKLLQLTAWIQFPGNNAGSETQTESNGLTELQT